MRKIIAGLIIISLILSNINICFAGDNLSTPYALDDINGHAQLAKLALEIELKCRQDFITDVNDINTVKDALQSLKENSLETGEENSIVTFKNSIERIGNCLFSIPVSVTYNGKREDYTLLFSTILTDEKPQMFPVRIVTQGELRDLQTAGEKREYKRNDDGAFAPAPGKSPEDAFFIIFLSGTHERETGFTVKDYLESYRKSGLSHPGLEYEKLAKNPRQTARQDLKALEKKGYLKKNISGNAHVYKLTESGLNHLKHFKKAFLVAASHFLETNSKSLSKESYIKRNNQMNVQSSHKHLGLPLISENSGETSYGTAEIYLGSLIDMGILSSKGKGYEKQYELTERGKKTLTIFNKENPFSRQIIEGNFAVCKNDEAYKFYASPLYFYEKHTKELLMNLFSRVIEGSSSIVSMPLSNEGAIIENLKQKAIIFIKINTDDYPEQRISKKKGGESSARVLSYSDEKAVYVALDSEMWENVTNNFSKQEYSNNEKLNSAFPQYQNYPGFLQYVEGNQVDFLKYFIPRMLKQTGDLCGLEQYAAGNQEEGYRVTNDLETLYHLILQNKKENSKNVSKKSEELMNKLSGIEPIGVLNPDERRKKPRKPHDGDYTRSLFNAVLPILENNGWDTEAFPGAQYMDQYMNNELINFFIDDNYGLRVRIYPDREAEGLGSFKKEIIISEKGLSIYERKAENGSESSKENFMYEGERPIIGFSLDKNKNIIYAVISEDFKENLGEKDIDNKLIKFVSLEELISLAEEKEILLPEEKLKEYEDSLLKVIAFSGMLLKKDFFTFQGIHLAYQAIAKKYPQLGLTDLQGKASKWMPKIRDACYALIEKGYMSRGNSGNGDFAQAGYWITEKGKFESYTRSTNALKEIGLDLKTFILLKEALALIPESYNTGGLNYGLLSTAFKGAEIIEEALTGKTALMFSEKTVFDNGLGVLLPKLAASEIKVGVIVGRDNQKQKNLIDELNRDLGKKKKIFYNESIAELCAAMKSQTSFYYFKVQGEAEADIKSVITIDITDKINMIIQALGNACGILQEQIEKLYQAARTFAEAA